MLPFLWFRCFHVSNSAEGLRFPRCDGDDSGTVMAANFTSAVPEYGNASPAYYVAVEDASTQVSEEDLAPVEPTREASTQVSEEDLAPVEPTREASTQVSEEDLAPVEPTREASTQTSDDDFPSKIAGSHEYENCTESETTPENKTTHDLDQHTNENINRVQVNSNANEGEFHDQFYDVGNAATLVEVAYDKAAASQQTYLSEESSFTEGENKNSDEFLRWQGTKEPTERGIKSDSFAFTDSISLEPAVNLSDSSEKGEDREDNIPPPFSSFPRGTPSTNKCFQENSLTAIGVSQQTPQTSNKFSKRKCKNCGRFFLKEWTFYAHLQGNCNKGKRYKCKECGELFAGISALLLHQRVHAWEKPFKCTQCDFASKWPHCLKKHLEMHPNILPSISPISRKKTPVKKYLPKKLLKSKTVKQKKPKSSKKFKILRCKKCRRHFMKESTFIAHVQSNCSSEPYKCGQCDERFPWMNSLIEHRVVHTAEKPFKCTLCDYASKWPQDLKKHLETHH